MSQPERRLVFLFGLGLHMSSPRFPVHGFQAMGRGCFEFAILRTRGPFSCRDPDFLLYWRCERRKKSIQTQSQKLFHCYPPLVFYHVPDLGFVGTLLAAEVGPILWEWYALVCIGIVCFHASANIYNDYSIPVTGWTSPIHRRLGTVPSRSTRHSRPGMFTPGQLLTEGIVLNGITVLIGLILSLGVPCWFSGSD